MEEKGFKEEKVLNQKSDYVFVWLTRDSSGLIQMWKYKPKRYKSIIGQVIFGDPNRFVGIKVNSIFDKLVPKEVCCIKYCLVKSKSDDE